MPRWMEPMMPPRGFTFSTLAATFSTLAAGSADEKEEEEEEEEEAASGSAPSAGDFFLNTPATRGSHSSALNFAKQPEPSLVQQLT